MKPYLLLGCSLGLALAVACSETATPDNSDNGGANTGGTAAGQSGGSAGTGLSGGGQGGTAGAATSGGAGAFPSGGAAGTGGAAGAANPGGSAGASFAGSSGQAGNAGASGGAGSGGGAAGGQGGRGGSGASGASGNGGSGPVSCTRGPARGARTLRIMPVGDSITRSTCWRAKLWQTLGQTHATMFDFVGTLNNDAGCGVSGDDRDNQGYGSSLVTEIAAGITNARTCDPTCPTLATLETAFATVTPDVVLMHFGTNDVWNGRLPADILSAYGAVIDRARLHNPNVIFMVAQIIPMAPDTTTCTGCTLCSACPAGVTTLNGMIPAWAAGKTTAASPVCVVDQWTGFVMPDDTRDRVHPNDSGSTKMAAKWAAAVNPLF